MSSFLSALAIFHDGHRRRRLRDDTAPLQRSPPSHRPDVVRPPISTPHLLFLILLHWTSVGVTVQSSQLPVVPSTQVLMSTDGQVYVVNAGQFIEIQCEFTAEEFNMFDNPVVWKKFQRTEDAQINIMGNIFEPFLATNRFEVGFASEEPHYSLTLRISNLTAEDSGNYTCEVRGRKSIVLASVTHFIFVRASVKTIFLTEDDPSPATIPFLDNIPAGFVGYDDVITPYQQRSQPASTLAPTLRRVVFVEDVPHKLRCVSTGGYPHPELRVYLNDKDITSIFTLLTSATLYGKYGLRFIVTHTELRTDRLALTANDDGDKIRCVATVPGLAPNSSDILVEVQFGPIITCPTRLAQLDDRNVFLRCEVVARPGLTSLFWIIDVNGTTLSDGEVSNEYWSVVTDRSDGVMESTLFMKQAFSRSFRTYTMVAENSIASSTQLVHLERRKPIFSIDIHPDGSRFATGGQGESSGKVAVWNMGPVRNETLELDENVPKLLCQMDNHLACVNCVRWSNDGRCLASGGDDKLVMIWQTSRSSNSFGSTSGRASSGESWRVVNTLRGHHGDVLDLAWSLHNAWLATCSVDNTIIVWNALKFPEQLSVLRGHTGLVKGVTWDPIGKYLASQSDDKTVRVWRTFDWQLEATISEPFQQCSGTTHVLRLSWSPDGQYIVTAHAMNNNGPTAQIIERSGWKFGMDFVGHRKAISVVRFNSRLLEKKLKKFNDKVQQYTCCAIGSRDRSLSVWITALKRPLVVIHDLFSDSILDITWSGVGDELMCCSWDGTVAYLNFTTAEVGHPLTDEQKMNLHKKLYGKNILTSGLDQSSQIIESPAMLNIQQQHLSQKKAAAAASLAATATTSPPEQQLQQYKPAPVPPCSNSMSAPPLDRQIETRTKDGKRRITPIFLAPQPDVGDIPLPYASGGTSQPVFTSTKEMSSILIEKKDEITSPVSSLKFKDSSRSMTDGFDLGLKAAKITATESGLEDSNSKFCTPEQRHSTTSIMQSARITTADGLNSENLNKLHDRPSTGVGLDEIPKKKDNRGRPRKDRAPDYVRPGQDDRTPDYNRQQHSQQTQQQTISSNTPVYQQQQLLPTPAQHNNGQAVVRTDVNVVNTALSTLHLPACSIDHTKSIQISVGSSTEAAMMLELENDVLVAPGYCLHRVRCTKLGRQNWEAFVSSKLTAATGNSVLVCCSTDDCTLSMFSTSAGVRLCSGIALDGQVSALRSSGAHIMSVTTVGTVNVWNMQNMSCTIKNESLLPLFTYGQTKIDQFLLSDKGMPVIVFNNGRSYTYEADLRCWVIVAVRDDVLSRCSNYQSCLAAPTDARHMSGALATLQSSRQRSSGQAAQLARVAASIQQSSTLSYLESQLVSCLALKSSTEYRFWLLTYVRYLVQEGCETKLREVCDDLLGPFNASANTLTQRWKPAILGHDKRSILTDILPIIGSNLQLQRIFIEYREQLNSLS